MTDFLRNFSLQFLFTLRVFARNRLRENCRRNTYRTLFWCLAWRSNPSFSSNKPTRYLLDRGDYNLTCSNYVSALFTKTFSSSKVMIVSLQHVLEWQDCPSMYVIKQLCLLSRTFSLEVVLSFYLINILKLCLSFIYKVFSAVRSCTTMTRLPIYVIKQLCLLNRRLWL